MTTPSSADPMPRYDEVEVGTELPERTVTITRDRLVRYAGASGDFNPIHWNEKVAVAVGLPDVIAHGMLTMAEGATLVTAWIGDPGRIIEYGVRFGRPVVVPNDADGATLVLSGRVAQKLEENKVRVDITARCGEQKVLSLARAVVRLA